MKTNKIILAALMAVATFFAACTEEAPEYQPAQPETNEVQAYIYNNTVTSYQFVKLQQTFSVEIGRNKTQGAVTFDLLTNDTIEAFVVEPVVFADGENSTTVDVTVNLSYGESYDLVLAVPEEYTTAYGAPQVSISILVDFTWLPMGAVEYQSQWEGTTATVAIECAKEYTDEAGNKLFRLNSPYFHLAPNYCTVEGIHLQFLLDKDYNAVDLNGYGMIQLENTGYNWIYWVPDVYPDYCQFINQGNIYAVVCLWTDGENLYGPYQEMWQWVDGYPGATE